MTIPNPYEPPRAPTGSARSQPTQSKRERPWSFLGAFLGPALGVGCFFVPIGPEGLLWRWSKGRVVQFTQQGQFFLAAVLLGGSLVGVVLGWSAEWWLASRASSHTSPD